MPRRSTKGLATKGRTSRKTRRQLWIPALAGVTLLSGVLLGNALDAHLLASEVAKTQSFDEGWSPFQAHLSQLSSRSAWLGLVLLVLAGFALPRTWRVVRRYFNEVRWMQPKPGLLLLAALFLGGGAAGFWGGSVVDRILTAMRS